MNQIKAMMSPQASKAFVAALLAALTAAIVAAPNGFTVSEILTIAVALVLTFQGTYWTTNVKGPAAYDGSIDVEQVEGKKIFSLNLNSDPLNLDTKNDVTFKIVNK